MGLLHPNPRWGVPSGGRNDPVPCLGAVAVVKYAVAAIIVRRSYLYILIEMMMDNTCHSEISKSREPEIRRNNPVFFLSQIVSTGIAWF